MQKELANVLRLKLTPLPFVDVLAGIAQVLTTTDTADEGTTVIKRQPVTYDVNINQVDCSGKEYLLTFDSSKKSIIYFEDFGIMPSGTKPGGLVGYISSLRLICWLNRANLVGDSYKEISGIAQASIISMLTHKGPENTGMFTRLNVEVAKIQPQDAGLFGKYTIDETQRQYLRPPFEFFGIDLTSKFFVSPKCIDAVNWNAQVCS